MRRGVFLTKFISLLLFLLIAVYMGYYIFNAMYDSFQTVDAIPVSAEEVLSLAGYIVRDEMLLDPIEGIVEIMPYEGKRVARGELIAVIYKDAQALERKIEADGLRLRIEQLEYSKRDYANLVDAAKLDGGIYEQLISLCENDDTRSLDELHDISLSLKSLIFKREYTFSEIESIDDFLSELYNDLNNLSGSADLDMAKVNSSSPGIYSGMTDGFEDILTPEFLSSLTPELVNSLSAIKPSPQPSAGKLVLGYHWYYIANVPEAEAANMKHGDSLDLRFLKSTLGEHTLSVESVSQPSNGVCAVVFSSSRTLADTIRLRRAPADIIQNAYSGIRVPKAAVRVYDGRSGVFCVAGLELKFKDIAIIYEKDNYYIVSEDINNPNALRLGDEIVVKGRDLEDGKVVGG